MACPPLRSHDLGKLVYNSQNKPMQRQRGELVPIGDALSGLGGPMKAIRDDSPQARRGFTVTDQVN